LDDGVGFGLPTSTSAAKRFAQLSKNAADDNTILRMSAYATRCPRFRKVNLAQNWNRRAMAPPAPANFAFATSLLQFE